jgi:hypothetical protein
MRRIIIMMSIGLFLTLGLCFAEEESLTITTYYPSPYGVYKQLRLHPSNDIESDDCDDNNEGAMYYDSDDETVYVCKGEEEGWVALGGGCSDVPGADQSNCWLDVDEDGYSPRTGDCDETCADCYVGSTAYTSSPDGYDQNCNGEVDEWIATPGYGGTTNWDTGTTCTQVCADSGYGACLYAYCSSPGDGKMYCTGGLCGGICYLSANCDTAAGENMGDWQCRCRNKCWCAELDKGYY